MKKKFLYKTKKSQLKKVLKIIYKRKKKFIFFIPLIDRIHKIQYEWHLSNME